MQNTVFLYGPPASGKSTLAKRLSLALGCPSVDLDEEIVKGIRQPISAYFEEHGEQSFRAVESALLRRIAPEEGLQIVSLGGGTLLSDANRQYCEERGVVYCLDAPDESELERRIASQAGVRPLGNKARERASHYASFPHRIARVFLLPDSLVLVGNGIAPALMASRHTVFDSEVARLYPGLAEGRAATIPSGEQYKTPETLLHLWHAFAEAGLGRKDGVLACGGGVTGDLTGFAAATWMRGIPWINVPTTLLSMVDASTGGKTGCDLPEGKNLAGAFHSPRLVVIDTDFLNTLPGRELRSGRSEMLKHCIIGMGKSAVAPDLVTDVLPTAREIAESLAVKIRIVSQDPHETLGKRILLNCGHTIGHAVEAASGYRLSHGESVAIGCVEEARLAVKMGLAPAAWPDELVTHFQAAGLPAAYPDGMDYGKLLPLMKHDKKIQGDTVEFALPCGWGDVRATKIRLS